MNIQPAYKKEIVPINSICCLNPGPAQNNRRPDRPCIYNRCICQHSGQLDMQYELEIDAEWYQEKIEGRPPLVLPPRFITLQTRAPFGGQFVDAGLTVIKNALSTRCEGHVPVGDWSQVPRKYRSVRGKHERPRRACAHRVNTSTRLTRPEF